MKRTVIIALWLVALASLAGCSFDLFHDTSWLTACEIDPSTPGCAGDADVDATDEAGDVGGGTDSDAGANSGD